MPKESAYKHVQQILSIIQLSVHAPCAPMNVLRAAEFLQIVRSVTKRLVVYLRLSIIVLHRQYLLVAACLNVQQDTIRMKMYARNVILLALFVNSQISVLNAPWIGQTIYFIFSEIINASLIVESVSILTQVILHFISVEIVLQIAKIVLVRKSAQYVYQVFF